jgi:hypothetical protein
LPFAFGASGGAVVTDSKGAVQLCSAGDGRPAIEVQYGLCLCLQCARNLAYQEARTGPGKVGDSNTVKAFVVANKGNDLQKR